MQLIKLKDNTIFNFLYIINSENYNTKQEFINAVAETNYDLIIIVINAIMVVISARGKGIVKALLSGVSIITFYIIRFVAVTAQMYQYFPNVGFLQHEFISFHNYVFFYLVVNFDVVLIKYGFVGFDHVV